MCSSSTLPSATRDRRRPRCRTLPSRCQRDDLGIMGRAVREKRPLRGCCNACIRITKGLIRIDGVDVREYDVDHLRRSLGVVLQENFLFSGTIGENITMPKRNASFDEVVRAARLAGAEEFIERLPRGTRHTSMRAPPIFRRPAAAPGDRTGLDCGPARSDFDEATSALDADSEASSRESPGSLTVEL